MLETPSPERKTINTQVETPNTGNEPLTNFNTVVQDSLGEINPGNQLTEHSQISNEIQTWTQILEQKNNDRIEKMREEMDNKFEAVLREIKTNKMHQLLQTLSKKLMKYKTQNHRDRKRSL